MKTRKVCIKGRSSPASLPVKGKVTKHSTVKWTIVIGCSVFLTDIGQLENMDWTLNWTVNRTMEKMD